MIEHQLTTLVLIFTVFTLTSVERKRLDTIITPFTVTAFPFAVIAFLVNFILVYLEFKPFTMRAQLFVLLNLLVLWLVGFFMSHFIEPDKRIRNDKTEQSKSFINSAEHIGIIIGLSWIAIVIIFRKVNQVLGQYGGFAFIGDPRFEKMMIAGLHAHMGEVAKVCFLLLGIFWNSSRQKWLVFITMVTLFIAIAALQVKYHLLWVLIMLFIYKIYDFPVKKQKRAVIWTGLAVIVVMNLFWILLTIAWKTFSITNKGVWQFLFEHTMLYITSAPIAFDQWLDFPDIKPEYSLTVVFMNIINVLLGNPQRISAMPFVNIGFIPTAHKMVSNVGTAYGVYYIIGGWAFTFFMTVCLSWIYYKVFFINRQKPNVITIFFNLFLLTLAALTFFVQYFTLLSFYEVILLYLIIVGILKILQYLRVSPYWLSLKDNSARGIF